MRCNPGVVLSHQRLVTSTPAFHLRVLNGASASRPLPPALQIYWTACTVHHAATPAERHVFAPHVATWFSPSPPSLSPLSLSHAFEVLLVN
ncbi:hypothetical protein AALO_G00292810 [Alosa alosa]|uniref:Uncharacterized protein n=1 Tax=Alosa alosa TaxID=278164 RepID=A0AAV6FH73_9TELE|nr:hypothetical protein AALO_G00292810 [Alosa alosa]